MPCRIAIVDFGMGNLNSVKRKLTKFNCEPIISSHSADIAKADKIILPGVGHFQNAVENLKKLKLIDALNEMVVNPAYIHR